MSVNAIGSFSSLLSPTAISKLQKASSTGELVPIVQKTAAALDGVDLKANGGGVGDSVGQLMNMIMLLIASVLNPNRNTDLPTQSNANSHDFSEIAAELMNSLAQEDVGDAGDAGNADEPDNADDGDDIGNQDGGCGGARGAGQADRQRGPGRGRNAENAADAENDDAGGPDGQGGCGGGRGAGNGSGNAGNAGNESAQHRQGGNGGGRRGGRG